MPLFVGNHSIPTAVALFQSTVATVNLVGPMLGGMLLIIDSASIIFSINAVTFGLSAILLGSIGVLQIRKRDQGAGEKEPYFLALRNGIREVSGIPALRFLLLILAPITFAVGMFITNYNALLLQSFSVSALQFGFLEGAFAGAGLLPVYFWCVLVGLGNDLYNVPLSSTFMQLSPSHLLGRGIALFTAIFNACYMLGVLFGGWLAGSTGIVITAVYAGLMLVATAIIFPWFRSYQGLLQVGTHEELQAS